MNMEKRSSYNWSIDDHGKHHDYRKPIIKQKRLFSGSSTSSNSSNDSLEKRKLFGITTGAILAFVSFSIVFTKFCVYLTGKPIGTLLTDTSHNLMSKTQTLSSTLISLIDYEHILWPLFCGFAVTVFTWAMVYLDSEYPGINPPSPLSPQKYRYGQNRLKTCHLSYLMAVASGVVVFCLLYCSSGSI